MLLSQLLDTAGAALPPGSDPEVSRVTADSRTVAPGTAFFAVRGSRQDGHDFAAEAAHRGAAAVVAEREVACEPAPLARVADARRALALAAARLEGNPGEALSLAGVTGTNGKTTVAFLVDACLRQAGVPSGLIGTVAYRWPGGERPAPHTTPDAVALQALLAEMRRAGARAAVLEVSSHALDQERVAGLVFRVAGFTNLTRDHLDYHGDLERYFLAKRRLFAEGMAAGGVAVVNGDDPFGDRLHRELTDAGRTAWRFGTSGAAEVRAHEVRITLSGIEASLETPAGILPLRSPLVGAHNLENLLLAAGMALGLGLPPGAVAAGLASSTGAPGRLERLEKGGVIAFVDYAHTDDALRRVTEALRRLDPRRLLVVFGCGGDRDRGKRPLMGEVAGRAADLAVVTSDNPRSEDPLAIIGEILPGLERAGARRLEVAEARGGASGYAVVPDRREAIALALAAARPGDAVLIAGKGHEDYQITGAGRRHFDDREEARRALGIA
ncbi:MAG: UDP-N-acetylmuramoyl-L-alanyl-D-glutamate--2,6-diaminopimelate ligase [Deltaproteobacteria bacterium]|nr:UDP-N-acetylmuramoyl-L-alanyl-D-glutamate--2,6-diaminopimelate ligase [Deltaproteobacteria bacterium]